MYTTHGLRRRRLPTTWVNGVRKGVYGLWGLPTHVAGRLEHAFILGHMRSGSSLLAKLLATSPEVMEHGELHLAYANRLDLMAMKGRLLRESGQLIAVSPQHVALDKLLHNHQLLVKNLKIIRDRDVRPIFLIRSPVPTVESIVRTFNDYSVERAVDYYLERVPMLEQYAAVIGDEVPTVAIDYDDIVQRCDRVFRLVERHLGLATELSTDYSSTFDAESHVGRGDPSRNLSVGRLLTETWKPDAPVEIPDDLLRKTTAVYERCRQVMMGISRTPGDDYV